MIRRIIAGGWVWLPWNRKKHEDLALVDLEEAIRLKPSSADAYLLRGNIYLTQKKKALAKTDFEKAISLGIPPADLHEQLKQCK